MHAQTYANATEDLASSIMLVMMRETEGTLSQWKGCEGSLSLSLSLSGHELHSNCSRSSQGIAGSVSLLYLFGAISGAFLAPPQSGKTNPLNALLSKHTPRLLDHMACVVGGGGGEGIVADSPLWFKSGRCHKSQGTFLYPFSFPYFACFQLNSHHNTRLTICLPSLSS